MNAMQITLLAVQWTGRPLPESLAQEVGSIDPGILVDTIAQPDLLAYVNACPPDVLLMEYDAARPESTWRMLSTVGRMSPGTRILLLCEDCSTESLLDFIQHNASGCLLRSTPASLFARAVRVVHEGQIWFGRSDLIQALRWQLGAMPAGLQIEPEHEALLTLREREILDLIGRAMSNKEIARQLKISAATVKTHLHHVYVKLQKSGRYKALLSEGDRHPRLNGDASKGNSGANLNGR
ncbi:response regulator transcription factor [Ramlibacter sp. WS9]|uniref:response regulator transcription factor n=1 Tax=Ramlibacter sp. WS9 TaxID=1882741 RepID=UPI001305149E|nr:response regulator transcription factor [Ramlibacter sp. WS9]